MVGSSSYYMMSQASTNNSHTTSPELTYQSYVPHYVKRRIAFHLCHTPHHAVENSEKLFSALVFADISGFTRLSSRLNAEDLKFYINDYFSIMLDVIDRCGGDVVKFCGDAVIIMWYATLSATVEAREACILKASLCALQLIESCGDYSKPLVGKDNTTGILEGGFIVTDSSATSSHASHEAGKDAVDLSLHCGISSGIVHCMILGRGERREFIVSGPAIESMGKAEASADKNEVCVTMDCKLVLEKYFVLDPAKNLGEHSGYYILKAELKHQEPKNADRDFPTPSTRKGSVISIAASHLVNRSKSLFQYAPRSGTSEGYDHDSSSILSVAEIMHLFSTARDPILREVVKYNVTPNFSHEDEYRKVQPSMQYQEVMKSFLHSTALSAVESHTYALLSEMRNIVTVFLSLHGLEVSLEQGLFDDVQEIFLLLLSTLDLHNGSLRQFVVDDKGCVAIVCFGLFGCNTTNNSLNALKFSVDFQQLIQQRQLSLCGGITCGRVYCGNVGSIRRCEFAVMGASVNLAARLMSACKGKGQFILVTEDIKNETMGSHAFVQTTSIVAKGYDHPIHVYAPIIAKRSFGQAVIMTAGPSPVESSSECNQTTVNKFLKTIQELNDSYIQQLQPIGTDFGRKGVMNKIVFDFNESKYFPPEVEKNILILTDQIKMSRGIFGKDQKEFSSALICGHSSSGKTSLLQRLCYDLLDQGFPKSKILFVNGSHNKKNHRSEEPYSLMREFLDLLVWDTDDGEASLSRFEAAALKVESYSHSSSDVILDFEDSSSLRDALPVHAKKELNFVCDPQSTNNLLKEPDTRFNANISLKKKKDFRLFASIQTLCHDHLNTPTNFAKYVAITEFEQLSLIECINSLFESPSDDVCGQISTHFVDKLFYVLCGSHNLVDFIYSFLYGSLSFKVASTQVVDRIFIMILLMLFGVFPKTSQNKIDTSLPRLIALVDDVDSSDPSSMRIIAEVVKFLHQHTQLCEDRGELGCVIMTWTLNEGDSEARPFSSDPLDIADLDLNGSSMMARQILGRKKQDNKLSALQNKHHKRCSTKNPIFQLFEEQCHLRISMSNFSVNSIHGLLHSTLGERRWEWLLRKITGLLLKHENSATFGRRHGFVTEQLSTDRTYETNYSREREVLHEANHHIVSDIYALTNSGTPPMVFQILLSLRHAIDHGIFISIQDLPIMRQRKEKIMEWLDGLNGSELAILKAASVVGGKFSVDLLRKGLMSLDMEYCCADMVLNSALLRLRRIGIVRKSFDNTVVTSNSAKCEVHADIDHDMNDSFQFEFVDDSIRLSIYNLMLESQKAAVHGAIASYYENDYMSSKIFSQWYPICQHYMKSNAADKMTEYSWKLLQYHVSTHRHLDVIQVCGVLVSLLGAPKERIMIKQTASNIEKQIDKLPAFVFKSKMFPKNISPISALTKRMTPIRKCDDRKSFVLDNISRIFQWEVRQPNSSLFISSSNADIPSKRTHRRSSTSIRSAYLPNIGRTNRVAIDSTSGIDKDAKEELRHVDYRCGLIHHFSKELVAHHLFATSWTSSKIFKGQPTESSYLPGQFAFRTEILDLVLLASVVDQLSYAYMCLGHSIKTEDCCALALCLLQHNRNIQRDKTKLNKLLNITIPETDSLSKDVNVMRSCSPQEKAIESSCQLRLVLLGILRGDVAAAMLLLQLVDGGSILKDSLLRWTMRITGSFQNGASSERLSSSNLLAEDRDGNLTFRSAFLADDVDDGCSGKGGLENRLDEYDSNKMYQNVFSGLTCVADGKLQQAIAHFTACDHTCDLQNNMTIKLANCVFLGWCYLLLGNFKCADSVIGDVKLPLILKQSISSNANPNECEEFHLSKSCSIEIVNFEHVAATFKIVFVSPAVMGRAKHIPESGSLASSLPINSSSNLLRGCFGHHEWSSQCYDMFRIVMEPSSDLEEALLTTKSTLPLLAYYLGGKYPLKMEGNEKIKMTLDAFHFRYFSRPMILFCDSEKDFSQYYSGHDSGSSFFPTSPFFHIAAFMIIFASCRLLLHQIEMVNLNAASSRFKSNRSTWYDDMEAINIESMVTIMFAISAFDGALRRSFPILNLFSLVLHVQLQLLLHSIRDYKVFEFLTHSMLPQILEVPSDIHTSWKFKTGLRTFLCRFNASYHQPSQKYVQSKGCSYAINFLRHLGDFLDINAMGRYPKEKTSSLSTSFEGETISTNFHNTHQYQADKCEESNPDSWFGKWMIQWQYEELRHLLHNTDSTA